MTDLDLAFSALADPVRRDVVRLLVREPHRPSDLAAALTLTRPATSKHLRVLRRAGLVRERAAEHDARERIYEARLEALAPVRGWIEEVEAFWNRQLAAFAAHVEKQRKAQRRRR
ncbi:MAG: metalloregulator ArsR/SmtB family transcription factor [Planctomycetota bacterium]